MTEARKRRFEKSFTRQEPIPEAGIESAVRLLRSGRLHRYDADPGDAGEVDRLELEFAAALGVPYALACASGGYALQLALRAAGLRAGEPVLTNAFTLAPVPGAIDAVNGKPVFVEVDEDLRIDLEDLDEKAARSGARFLLLSHMRGHLPDLDRVLEICTKHGLFLIEDCAHTMGAAFRGRPSGSDADVACFSTQTYKHINSGEGGLLTTQHDDVMARAIVLSGSYMLYERHAAAPPAAAFESIRTTTPNLSGRMDNLRAAILRPQLATLTARAERWRALYDGLERGLAAAPALRLPRRHPDEDFVPSSIQFSLPGSSADAIAAFVDRCAARGVVLKWFGRPEPQGYTSRFDSWRFLDDLPELPRTRRVLSTLLDLRIPLTFDEDDCEAITAILRDEIASMSAGGRE